MQRCSKTFDQYCTLQDFVIKLSLFFFAIHSLCLKSNTKARIFSASVLMFSLKNNHLNPLVHFCFTVTMNHSVFFRLLAYRYNTLQYSVYHGTQITKNWVCWMPSSVRGGAGMLLLSVVDLIMHYGGVKPVINKRSKSKTRLFFMSRLQLFGTGSSLRM